MEEVRVPVDRSGDLLEIGPALREALGLLPEIEGFEVARLYRIQGDGWILEVVRTDTEGRRVRQRRPLSGTEVEALRAQVSEVRAAGPAPRRDDGGDDGRTGLILTTTGLGLGFYGFAVPAVLDLDNRGYVAAYLLTAGASFYLPWQLTRGVRVSEARRDAVGWGTTRGAAWGALLGDALTGGEEDDDGLSGDDGDEDAVVAAAVAGSLLGGALGWAAGGDLSRGRVAWTATAADFALAYGFGTAHALGLYEETLPCPTSEPCSPEDEGRRTPEGHLVALGLGAAGTWAGWRWAEARDPSVGQARALRSFGVLGAQAAAPLGWAVFEDDDNERAFVATLLAGSAAGLALGDRLLPRRELTPGDGLLVLAGHLAGGAAALGVTYLLDPEPRADELVYLTTSALGSAAGAWVTLRAVGEDAPHPGADGAAAARGPSVELHPLALLPGLVGSGAASTRRPTRPAPWLTLRF